MDRTHISLVSPALAGRSFTFASPGFPASVLNCFSEHSPTCYAVSHNKLCTCFHSLCLFWSILAFKWGKESGSQLLTSNTFMIWWLGVLVFIRTTQVQFLGRELRSLFRTIHCCLSRSVTESMLPMQEGRAYSVKWHFQDLSFVWDYLYYLHLWPYQ